MRIILVLITITLAFSCIYCQPNNSLTKDYTPPSPNTGALFKFNDIPVSLYTGTPNISIPLVNISDGPISVPVSLSYHASGLKVAETASWVGAGWALNAGGTIHRQIQGKPDEQGYYNDRTTIETLSGNNLFSQLALGTLDGEPDMFSFNFLGYSGKFMFNSLGEFEMIPKQNFKVQIFFETVGIINIQSILITDDKGTKYFFGSVPSQFANLPGNNSARAFERETLFDEPVYDFSVPASGFQLVKIVSHDDLYVIDLHYTDEYFSYKSPASVYFTHSGCSSSSGISGFQEFTLGEGDSDLAGYHNQINMLSAKISKIVSNSIKDSIVFISSSIRSDLDVFNGSNAPPPNTSNGAWSLDKIKYFANNSGICKEYELQYKYFLDDQNSNRSEYKKLKLTTLQEKNCNQSINIPAYKFYYEGESSQNTNSFYPNRFSKAVDHWGYYNGHSNNHYWTTLNGLNIPATNYPIVGSNATYGGSNREANSLYSKTGVLNKILYPTGGSQVMNYEGHDVINFSTNVNLDLKNCSTASGNACCQQNSEQSGTITLLNSSLENYMFYTSLERIIEDGESVPIYCNEAIGPEILVSVFRVIGTTETYLGALSYNMPNYETFYESAKLPLPNFSSNFAFELGATYKFKLNVTNGKGRFVIENQVDGVASEVGGLRIKELKTFVNDGLSSPEDIVKTFEYKSTLNNVSSGFLISKPIYARASTMNVFSGNCTSYIFSENTVFPLSDFNGNHIGYKEVKEISNNNGFKLFKYYVLPVEFVSNGYTNPPPQYYGMSGLEYDSEIKGQNNVQNQKTSTNYENRTVGIPGTFYKVFRQSVMGIDGQENKIMIIAYYRITAYDQPIETVTTFEGVTTTKNNTYTDANSPYRLLLNTSTSNSDNKTYSTEYKYALDLPISTLRTSLLSKNILTPLEEINTAGSTIVSGTKTEWSFFNSAGSPTTTASQWLYPYKHYSIETTWNASNQPLYTGGAAGTWILKGTLDKVNTVVGRPSEFTLAGWDKEYYNWNNTTKLLISKQYGNFTWLYEYYPNSKLIKKITDIDGQFIDYEYDPLMRLKKITERNGNRVTDFTYYYRLDGSSGTQNFVEKKTTFTPTFNSTLTELKDREYFDGLGRTIQTVKVGYSPGNKDVIAAVKYDNIGRPFKKYEPYESNFSTGTFFDIPDNAPHTLTTYEASPLNRPLTVTPPSWYATTLTYGANTVADGVKYASNLTTNYSANTLMKETVADPNGNKNTIFKDKLGRVILVRKSNSAETEISDTYTDYDDKGRVDKVYPPGASTSTPGLIFSYLYDAEDKVTWKKVPDMDGVTIHYNSRDLPAATWLPRENKWMVANYDTYGRLVSNGLTTNATLVSNLESIGIYDIMYQALYDGQSGLGVIRTASAIDKGKVTTEQIKIIGTLNFKTSTNIYDAYGRVGTQRSNNHLNLAAISTTSSPESWVYTYDFADNMTSEIRAHAITGHFRTVTATNVFNSKGLLQNIYFEGGTGESNRLISTLNYTHKDQLLSKLIGVNNTLQKLDYTYNNQGWLTSINPAMAVPNNFVLYPVTMPTGTGSGTNDLFHMSFQYDNLATNVGTPTAIQKNGNIAQIQYQTIGREKEYWSYNYDYLDRLVNAVHTRMSSNGATAIGQYTENITYDGPRGNITSIQRYGMLATMVSGNYTTLQTGLIDNLSMIYQAGTNRLATVTDNGHPEFKHLGFNQVPGSGATAHSYDASGNMTYDHSKRATIEYNHLNLPKSITFQNGNKIDYTYDASGKKLTSLRSTNSTPIDKQQYLDGIEYKDISGSYRLESIYHPEGRIYNINVTNTATTAIVLRHELCIKDHLGNTRLTFYDRPSGQGGTVGQIEVPAEILQENQYYPFGMSMEGPWMNDITASDKPYQYNGKELESFGGLGWYDYGARYYDPSVGRWTGVDPIVENGPQFSPYIYTFNNPIKYIDPDGKWPTTKVVEHKKMLSGFGLRIHPKTGKLKGHTGQDYSTNGTGHGVHALADGVVKKIGWNRKVDKEGNVIGYGRYVVIAHKDGYESLYAHLEKDEVKFKVGDKVNDGDIIAVSGNTGGSTGPHLHLEISKGDILKKKNKIDPATVDNLQILLNGQEKKIDNFILKTENTAVRDNTFVAAIPIIELKKTQND